ncbi:hypothetical protein [Geminocystis sp. GBBB08]|uniref:hypothetical protein n=1 Tax=Geminocystis sp. GBBB08 TaxID=2604140 RepID=UPI0027E2BB46|nr:hypothetical protein [Geminocystis sp. GBBB08]MBL1208837.1 hypothetical protein [Geminocystis sp. GBBB08]
MIDTSNYSFSHNPEENQTQSLELQRKYYFWRWFLSLCLLFLGGGLSYGWYFLTQKLIPLIETPVSHYISRPVKLGKIEAVSFTKIRLGETRIDSTENENDSVIAEAIEISFNPLQLLGKNVDLGISVINSSVYLQQNKDDSWINIKLNPSNEQQILKWNFNVDKIQLKNSQLIVKNNHHLKDLPSFVTQLIIPSANISFQNNQSFFQLKGNFLQGGDINITGLHNFNQNQWLLKINSQDLAINTLNNLMILPIDANSGKVDGNVSLNFSHNILDNIQGDVTFNHVNFKLPNLPNQLTESQGKVTFDNELVKLENINTNLGLINTQVNGVIHKNQQLNIQANTTKPIEIKNVFSSLNLDTDNLETIGKVTGKVNLLGDIHNPKISANIVNSGITQFEKIPFNKVTTNLDIHNNQLIINNVSLIPTIGGEVTATGKINLLQKKDDSFNISLTGKNIDGKKLVSIYQQELPINVGLISGNYNLSGNWQQFNQAKLTGISTVELAGGKANIDNLEVNHDTWRGEVTLAGVKLTQLPILDCQKIGCNDSFLNGEFQASGKNEKIDATSLNLLGNFDVNFSGGKLNLINTKISQGNWQTLITAENLLLSQLPLVKLTSLGIDGGKVSTNLDVKGNLTNNDKIQIQGKGKLDLPEGRININNFTLAKDNFIAETNTVNFSLHKITENLRGDVSGKVTARGNINNLTAEKINLDGDLVFSQGISLINQPISANFSWNGENLRLNKGMSDGIQAKGIINVDINTKTVKDIDLDIVAKEIDLQNLSLPSSLDILNYQGKVDFLGNLQGKISQPQLKGKVTVNNFQLVNLAFSSLQGNITANLNEGLNLKLNAVNSHEKFYLQLDKENQPQLIDLQIKETQVKAIKNDEILAINAINIPLDTVTKTWLSYLPSNVKKIGGNLIADVSLNLNNYELVTGNIVIDKPSINHLQGDKLTTQLSEEKGVIKIEDGKLSHQQNEYLFAGELQPFAENPQLKAKVEIKEGEIQNLLSSWQIFELKDIPQGFQPREYSKANDLYSVNFNSNSQEKSVSSSSPLSNSQEKSVSSSPSLSNSQEKSVSSSPSLSNSQEKSVSSPSLSNSQEKSVSSPSLSNSQEKSVSSPSPLSNSQEKSVSSSSPLSNSQEKILPSSPSLSNSQEKTLPSSPSLSNSQEKSVSSPSLSNSQANPLVSIQGNDDSLLDTLTFFRKIEAQLKQVETNRLNASLPSLESLQGKLTGGININLSFQQGIKAEFDFRGYNWLWGKYRGDSLQATGSYDNGLLTLLPVKIQSDNSILSLTGTFKSERISGEVMLSNFSISQLKKVANFPEILNIDGVINASIAVSGSEEKPLAKGNIELTDSSINGTKIDKTTASFGFRNSRIDFLANSNLTENTQPLTLIGSLPFQLFSNSLLPENNNFLLKLNLTQDGFALLDILSNNQLNWLKGEGDINLDINGKYSQIRNQITDIYTQGIATFKNGVIGRKILLDNPITNINGQVFFNFDQLTIPHLTGNFSGGNIAIAGGLPLINNSFSHDSLNINVDDLALNVNSLYQGSAHGLINVSNSAIAPKIGGKIKLYNGEIKVGEKSDNYTENIKKNNFINTNFNNLQLILDKNFSIK